MPPLVWLIVAFLAGLLIEWLLEIFFFRRGMLRQIDAEKQTVADLRARSKDATLIQAQLDKVYVDLQVCSIARDNLQAQSKELETRLVQAASDAQASANAQASLEKELAECKTELAKAKVDLSASVNARAKLDTDLKARDAEIAKLHSDLDAHLAQNRNLTADVAKFTTGVATATATVKALEGDKAGLEKQVAELQAQLGKVSADLSATAHTRAQLGEDLKARDAEIAKLRADLDGHIAQNKTLAADVAKFTTGVATATATVKALEGDKAGLEKQVAELQAQLGKVNAELSATAHTRAQLGEDLKARDAEIAKLRADLDGHLAQNKNLTADVAKFTAGAATATLTVHALEGDKAALTAQIEQMKGDLSACQNARAMLETNLKEREAEIAKLHVLPIPAPAAAVPEISPAPDVAKLRNRSVDDETPFETACPQHLSDVKGIGTVFETRLYEAGVGSYWELAQLSNADLKRILKLTDLQAGHLDLNALRSDARRLAKETKSLGRKWSQAVPDDFEPIKGIGFTFEKRLYDAGICTYESLASADVEMLDEICQAPAQFKPDYAAWIKRAKSLAAKKAKRGSKL